MTVTPRPDGWFVVAATYPTAAQARRVWQQIEAAPWRPNAGIGVMRLSAATGDQPGSNCPRGRHPVVGVTTNPEAAARLAEELAGGEPWEPWKDLADAMVDRRTRVVSMGPVAALSEAQRRDTQVTYGRGGRVIMRRPEPDA